MVLLENIGYLFYFFVVPPHFYVSLRSARLYSVSETDIRRVYASLRSALLYSVSEADVHRTSGAVRRRLCFRKALQKTRENAAHFCPLTYKKLHKQFLIGYVFGKRCKRLAKMLRIFAR